MLRYGVVLRLFVNVVALSDAVLSAGAGAGTGGDAVLVTLFERIMVRVR